MEHSTKMTRRASARTAVRRGSRGATNGQSSSSRLPASNVTSPEAESSLEVTFCSVERVAGRVYLALCTPTHWRLFRLDGFSAARDSCTPVQLTMDVDKDAARLSRVRFFRLYQLPPAVATAGSASALGAVFVSERRPTASTSDEEGDVDDDYENFVTTTAHDTAGEDGQEDLTVLSLDEQRVLHKLPPSPSLVLDVQTNASVAAVLCETRELFLYDLATFRLLQCITTASPAMALGARWLAYPGVVSDASTSQSNGHHHSLDHGDSVSEDEDEDDDMPIEALVGGGTPVEMRSASYGSSPSYTAIDVAQNVASGLYYLSEVGRATIAPYLASSPGAPSIAAHAHHQPHRAASARRSSSSTTEQQTKAVATASESKQRLGWVVVQDLATQRVVANFPCHSTALVNLSLDFSGLLLATSSTKGQNLHVFRLSPPLQTVVNQTNGATAGSHGALQHQLLYKLQRGITHASIQDIAFSQDGKWINVTSAHGTSHLYALHPEGARVNADTHANAVDSASSSTDDELTSGFPRREVNDFFADFRTLETRTQTQVLRIRHELKLAPTPTVAAQKPAAPTASSKAAVKRSSSSSSSSSLSSTSSSSSPPGYPFHSPPTTGSTRSSTIMESALDASQALLSQLATSAMDFGHQHFEHDMNVEARRRRLRRRLSCLFAPDGLKMLICCDSELKLYGMVVTALSQLKADRAFALSSAPKTKSSKSSLSSFGFEASVTELKSWELLAPSRRKTEPFSSAVRIRTSSSNGSDVDVVKTNTKSELRTFAQRSLPLWAHPKVTFKAIDEDFPEGHVLEVKRKGPNPSQDLSASAMALAPEGYVNGDEQLFVMEMDSYFGIGGSPVFDGRGGDRPTTPEMPPPLDLEASINLAMSSAVPTTPSKSIPTMNNTKCLGAVQQGSPPETNAVSGSRPSRKSKSKKKNRGLATPTPQPEASESEGESAVNGGLASLQFTLQDMYFAMPSEEATG
ncbi:hypothetical protein BBJ28_00004875 [Nothophytophthora sp. Chile5]|nr:hypothetical protein BBJ28_00004875 [Nothophytophthora sp. Chile5]